LRIAIVLAVESHPRGFTFRSHRIFKIVLNIQRINESNWIFKKWEDELNFVPRKICRPCACKFPISRGTAKYSAWIFHDRVDVRGRHLWPREISISSYYSWTCSFLPTHLATAL
jgi:hypothetical protein